MNRPVSFAGRHYGRLLVLDVVESRPSGRYWKVQCECGQLKWVSANNLRSGSITSCGCGRHRTHGQYEHEMYSVWQGMLGRCNSPTHRSFHSYGGRGIKVCKRWLDFANFLKDMEPRPEGTSLERKKNHLGYSPGNCHWATAKEQGRNRRDNVHVTYKGVKMTMAEATEKSGLKRDTIQYRIKAGWPDPFQKRKYIKGST